jgi:hypothetical protein
MQIVTGCLPYVNHIDSVAPRVQKLGRPNTFHKMKRFNDLQLNGDKSEVISMGTASHLRKLTGVLSEVSFVSSLLPASRQVKSLGITLDSCLRFDTGVSNVVRAYNYDSRALRHIRNMLTTDIAEAVACSSRLD